MTNSKFENKKFVLNYQYDESIGRFEKMEYIEKDINDLEKKILTEACLLCIKCSTHSIWYWIPHSTCTASKFNESCCRRSIQ